MANCTMRDSPDFTNGLDQVMTDLHNLSVPVRENVIAHKASMVCASRPRLALAPER